MPEEKKQVPAPWALTPEEEAMKEPLTLLHIAMKKKLMEERAKALAQGVAAGVALAFVGIKLLKGRA